MDARVVSEIAVLIRFGPRGSLKADLHSISVCKLQMSLHSTDRMERNQNSHQLGGGLFLFFFKIFSIIAWTVFGLIRLLDEDVSFFLNICVLLKLFWVFFDKGTSTPSHPRKTGLC